jgi:hypothetical protein
VDSDIVVGLAFFSSFLRHYNRLDERAEAPMKNYQASGLTEWFSAANICFAAALQNRLKAC